MLPGSTENQNGTLTLKNVSTSLLLYTNSFRSQRFKQNGLLTVLFQLFPILLAVIGEWTTSLCVIVMAMGGV
jgi:hypothetical protein